MFYSPTFIDKTKSCNSSHKVGVVSCAQQTLILEQLPPLCLLCYCIIKLNINNQKCPKSPTSRKSGVCISHLIQLLWSYIKNKKTLRSIIIFLWVSPILHNYHFISIPDWQEVECRYFKKVSSFSLSPKCEIHFFFQSGSHFKSTSRCETLEGFLY
jgi:hypothetical protein